MDTNRKYIALVTGATGGLGTAICKRLADEGFHVIANYNSQAKADVWKEKMKGEGYDFEMHQADVSDYEAVGRMIEDVEKSIGQIDVLVNNAGITRDGQFRKMTKDNWDMVMKTNLDSVFNCTRHVINQMMDRSYGMIMNIS